MSWLEQLCLKSFADAGHETTLYSYEPIPNIPAGVKAGQASTIFPADPMYRHARTGSPAIHADLFRLNMIKQTGEVWVDADMYCYRPFKFPRKHIFGWEKPGLVCNAVLGLPKNSAALKEMLAFFKDEYAIGPWLKPWQQKELQEEADAGRPVHMTEQNWGFTGPAALTYFLQKTGEIEHSQPETGFYPIGFPQRNHLILSRFKPEDEFTDDTFGVHFWARRMKPRLEEKENGTPRRGSFMDKLIIKHGIKPDDAPIPAKIKRPSAVEDDPKLCAEIAIEALKGEASYDKLSRKYLVEKALIKRLEAQLRAAAPQVFAKAAAE